MKAAVWEWKKCCANTKLRTEARGSAAKSEVIISDGRIGFPAVRKCDILMVMSQTAVDKHLKDLKKRSAHSRQQHSSKNP